MKVLVTGGAGFIGSNLVHHFAHIAGVPADCCPDERLFGQGQPGADMFVFDALTYAGNVRNLEPVHRRAPRSFVRGDVADGAAVAAAFAAFRPDVVIHLAAESHVDRSIADAGAFIRTNVEGTRVVLDHARRHDAAVLHVSTDEVYGSVDQGHAAEDAPLRPGSPYAASKAGSDLLVAAWRNTYGLKATVTRCTNNFGPRQHPEKLVPKMLQMAASGRPLPIYGSGQQRRDWIYVKDHCAALAHILHRGLWGEVFNVAGGNERTNLEIARAALAACPGTSSAIEHVADRPGHDQRYAVDDRRLRATGWAPRVPFEQGFKHTVAWMQAAA